MLRVLETALPVFVMLGIGMLCRAKRVLNQAGVDALKSVAVNIALPAVLFNAFAAADYSGNAIAVQILMFFVCCAALALGFLGARIFHMRSRLAPFLMTGYEAGMLGYGLFALLYRGAGNSAFAIIDLGQVLFVFTIYKILLNREGGARGALRDAASSPVLWAIAAGLIFGATGLYRRLAPSGVSGVIDSVTAFVSAPTGALILISIGYDLVLREIRFRRIATIVLMRIAIMGALLGVMLLVNRRILGGAIHEGALMLMFILPPPYVLPVFADGGDERADISSALSVCTLLSIALFAVMSALV